MNVITIEESALYELIERVLERLQSPEHAVKPKWISDVEAMQILGIKSKSTLQQFRDRGQITFSKVRHKLILYDRESIELFISRHERKAFNNGK
ncbi:helix-turn-helix domain-containing protein [Dyadobacter chenwenxiniae]|uniref:Helix-turn-helix domain-containing protein n=1 Tax=Dyadobacter chenwenxiniae TaxID=2906456 RepID=A0A9X1TKK4_9BACT|nr:helix-turn-helix domain-containing protein [Dyadobacter chenwenxiniae]MCF0061318.1 helix-turn-helix domain-containing protein [Dyadobacter chenwenxiniae]UON81140.1 helix-turn-helix domain-containing protein [Dyadobacter chenwenxiniae]